MPRRLKNILVSAAVTSLALAAAGAVSATTITGTLNYPAFFGGFSSTNYYNPNNTNFFTGQSYVPSGYGNSNSGPSDLTAGEPVVIGPETEFGYADDNTLGTADFTANSLTLQDVIQVDLASFQQTFTSDTPGFFNNLKLTNNSYPGGVTYNVTGDTLSVLFGGANAPATLPATFDADFTFGNVSAVPEPDIWAMMLMGVGVIGMSLRWRRKRGVAALAA
jgi:hypothetical protein